MSAGNNGMWGDFNSINAGPAAAREAGATMVSSIVVWCGAASAVQYVRLGSPLRL